MQKIAIIYYYISSHKYTYISLSAAVESSLDTTEISQFFPSSENDFLDCISANQNIFNKVIVCISYYSTEISENQKLVSKIKRISKTYLILIAGGPQPTGNPEQALNIGFDIVVRGEGEYTFSEIVKKIVQYEEYNELKGISLIKNGQIIHNGISDAVDINMFSPFNLNYNKFGPIEITRGCPFACGFCQTPNIFGRKQRHRDLIQMLELIKIMKEKSLNDIRFISSNILSYGSENHKKPDISKLSELFTNIKNIFPESKLFIGTFPSEVRPEFITKETIHLIKKFAFNDNIVMGAQTGSERLLEYCNRGHTTDDIYNAVELASKNDIKSNVDFIFGLPGETDEDVLLTVKMIERLISMKARIHAHTFVPLINTAFSKSPVIGINKLYFSTLNNWHSKGFIYGNWKEQEVMANFINIKE